MQIYLVGGAVRDKLLGRPIIEKDWVVVGATPADLQAKGFKQVGKDFPVFLHPETGEEYALARTERKTGLGYHGFAVHSSSDVTLEEDLIRRDLTVNAMAMDESGHIYDPFNGQSDLKARQLRHISPAFAEDPLRVLRVARFAARYAHLGFSIAGDTFKLMKQITESGELKTLSAERVWKETYRALEENSPHIYFEVLKACGGLSDWFPELEVLWGVPNPPKWHPEVDTGIHTMMVLEQAAIMTNAPVTRFAALCHDLGKGITPEENLPGHPGHEKSGVPLVKQFCRRLKTPTQYEDLAKIACEFHLHLHRVETLTPNTMVKLLEKTDAFRKPERFEQFLLVCESDFKGRIGFENKQYPQGQIMRNALNECLNVDVQALIAKGFQGKKLGDMIHQARVTKLRELLNTDG
ncbi:multifunctional CCA addition/repair protein [Aliikangiella maris]|uniref:Multifunctional CCA protein n=2 Tax=Aliikangiella maris TaxID=3162458 RepID=A0ABV3MLJ0_9GAMM